MPEYIPAPQLPQGLAQELIRMRAQSNPWGQLIQNLGQQYGGILQQQAQQNKGNLTPEQVQAIMSPQQPKVPGVAQGQPVPANYQGQVYQGNAMAQPGLFPHGLNPQAVSLVEQMSKQREAATKLQSQQSELEKLVKLKEESTQNINQSKMEIPVTDTERQLFKTAGLKLDENATSIRKEDHDAAVKILLSQKSGEQKKSAAASKAGTSDEKLWEGLNRTVNPINAPRGSLLGQAGQGNARADRALTTLNSKTVTPQQISAVVADYAGIMQGGAPHEVALRQMGYDNLANRWANLQQFITSNPKNVNSPGVVAKLRQMITEIKQVDNQIIQNNMATVENTHSGLLQKDPERWQKIKDSVTKSTGEKPVHQMTDAELLEAYQKSQAK